jgi:aspartate kinase
MRSRGAGDEIIVVVSAMAGETNRLFAIAGELCEVPDPRETDVLVATGEQVSAALLAIRLRAMGQPAVSFLAHQLRIFTDSNHGRARIKSIDSDAVLQALKQRNIVVVAGYQGVDAKGDITTLGRGASDLTAVALAAALNADLCEIYTDVDGVYTADPNLCPSARKLDRISYDEMLELAGLGAKVLQHRSVEVAKRFNVPLMVRSSFSEAPGTWVGQEDQSMEDVLVAGVTLDQNQSKITLSGVEDRPGLAAKIFGPIAAAGIIVDMIIQNASADGRTDMTFTVARGDLKRALELVGELSREIDARGVRHDEQVAKVSIVGCGMRTHAGVAARMFEVLANERINIEMIATSEIKVSVVVNSKYGELAVRALHDAFLGADASQARAS